MKEKQTPRKKLQEILSRKNFEELDLFRNRNSWKALSKEDRQLLASLFIMQGEKQLAKEEIFANECFNLADQVSPDNPEVLFRIGCAFGNQADHIEHILTGKAWIEKCLILSPESFNPHLTYVDILILLGIKTGDSAFLLEADKHFKTILEEARVLEESIQALVYWKWGYCYFQMGKISGEAVDFHHSIEKFRLAAEKKMDNIDFWIYYGNALTEQAGLLKRPDFLSEAIEVYRNALQLDNKSFEGWFCLACTFQRFFEVNYLNEYFTQAEECFKMASQIENYSSTLWLKWGQLYTFESKLRRSVENLNLSFEKYQRAAECDSENPFILNLWGESLILYGTHTENVDFIREGQQKILHSLEINPQIAESWYFYGCSLNELGRYFSDEQFYFDAIEKFQVGIQIKKEEPLLWYGLALSHFAVGELRDEAEWMEKASNFCLRVFENGGHNFRQFWNDWGVTLMKLGEISGEKSYIEDAIEKFEYAIFLTNENIDSPEIDPEWLYNYGCALDFFGDFTENISYYEKAIQVLEQVLKKDPTYHHARYNLALAYAHLGELVMDVESFHKSIEQFQLLLNKDAEDEMCWNDFGLTLIHLAQLIHDPSRLELSQKMYEIAESKLLQAVSLGCVQAYYNLACLYSLMGHFPASIHFLEKANQAKALPSLEDMMNDEWLDGVRETLEFQEFITDSFGRQISEY